MEAVHYYLKGKEAFDSGHFAEAIRWFERSNQIEEHFKSYEMLYHCWTQTGDTLKAAACIEKAYQCNPNNDQTAFLYAKMLAESGNSETALHILLDIIQKNPTYKKAAVLADAIRQQKTV